MTQELENVKINGAGQAQANAVRVLRPAVDIQALADTYVVRLDIPGAAKDGISARIDKSILTVSAKVSASAYADDSAQPVEYRREFSLAEDVETQTVNAVYDLGVLKITLKKKQQFLPKEIKIA